MSDRGPADSDPPGKKVRAKAVALDYSRGDHLPPRIVARGEGLKADKIVQAALDNDVKVRVDADLAELLAAYELGSYIPVEAFASVAEIMAYLYETNERLNRIRRAAAEPRGPAAD